MLVRILLIGTVLAAIATLFILGHWIAGHILLFAAVALFHYGTLVPNSSLFGAIQTHLLQPSKGQVWITIDDGPDPETTPRLLDLLDSANARATFFLIGSKAQAHPEITQEIARRGHGIGNHTFSHPEKSFWIAGPIRTRKEITHCQNVLTELIDQAPEYFRAPVGHSNPFTHPALSPHSLQLIGWSARGFDGLNRTPQQILATLEKDITSGAIILLHDARPHSTEVLRRTLDLLHKRNLTTCLPN